MISPKKLLFTAAVIVLPVFIIGYNASKEKVVLSNSTKNSNVNTNNTNTNTTTSYTDGEYTATGSYQSPGGSESINVTLTLVDGLVTDVAVVGNSNNPTSKQYQAKFIGGVQAVVVGKDISTLNLSKVSGSSLTPKGFNDALAKIKTEAQA